MQLVASYSTPTLPTGAGSQGHVTAFKAGQRKMVNLEKTWRKIYYFTPPPPPEGT